MSNKELAANLKKLTNSNTPDINRNFLILCHASGILSMGVIIRIFELISRMFGHSKLEFYKELFEKLPSEHNDLLLMELSISLEKMTIPEKSKILMDFFYSELTSSM